MQALRKPLLAVLLLIAAPPPAPGQTPGARDAESGSSYVLGTITVRETGEPLSGTRVILSLRDTPGQSSETTNERGLFRFRDVTPGDYRLRITHVGYKTVELELTFTDGDETRVDVEMVRRVVELEPLVVTATRQSLLRRVGFLDRRQAGIGRFVTREQVERRNPMRVTDLFRTMPGWRVLPGRRGSGPLVVGRGSCTPALYLDGARLLQGSSLDDVLYPEAVEAIEVYHSSQAPARFPGTGCGSVVAWSRDPSAIEEGRPLSWKRIVTALGFLALAIVATSH